MAAATGMATSATSVLARRERMAASTSPTVAKPSAASTSGTAGVERDLEGRVGPGPDVVDADVRVADFAEHEPRFGHVEHGKVRDDEIDDAAARHRQRAFAQDLRRPVLRRVFHDDHDAPDAGDQIHGAARSLDHAAGDHPVGEVAVGGHLQAAEDGEVDVAAADHRERVGAREDRRARQGRDRLLTRVDQIGIDLVFFREGADAEQAVLGLQRDVHAFRDVVGDERRDADAEVHRVAVAQLGGRAARHPLAYGRFALCVTGAADGPELDPLLVLLALYNPIDVNPWQVHVVRIDGADGHQLFDLGHADVGAGGDLRVEVAGRAAEDQVAGFVALPRFHDGDIRANCRFQDVLAAVERGRRTAFREDRADAGRRVERGDAGAAGAQPLGERSLRDELELELAGEHLPFEFLVLADVRGDDLPHLTVLEQHTRAE